MCDDFYLCLTNVTSYSPVCVVWMSGNWSSQPLLQLTLSFASIKLLVDVAFMPSLIHPLISFKQKFCFAYIPVYQFMYSTLFYNWCTKFFMSCTADISTGCFPAELVFNPRAVYTLQYDV